MSHAAHHVPVIDDEIRFSLDLFREARTIARVWAQDRLASWGGAQDTTAFLFNAMWAEAPAKSLIGHDPSDYHRWSEDYDHTTWWVNAIASFIARVASRHFKKLVAEKTEHSR
jgi:hypothetical protein